MRVTYYSERTIWDLGVPALLTAGSFYEDACVLCSCPRGKAFLVSRAKALRTRWLWLYRTALLGVPIFSGVFGSWGRPRVHYASLLLLVSPKKNDDRRDDAFASPLPSGSSPFEYDMKST